jgi:hypothetical protein
LEEIGGEDVRRHLGGLEKHAGFIHGIYKTRPLRWRMGKVSVEASPQAVMSWLQNSKARSLLR